jgi:antitoxin ParD1/3/4
MTIEINRPEIEALIQRRLHSGAFESVEDVLFDALEIQSEREVWLLENKDAIHAKIERGLAQFDRGEGVPGDQLRGRLEADKAVAPRPLRFVKPYLVAPEAEGDLRQIWRYLLGVAGLAIANRIQGELVDAFEGLADVPGKAISVPTSPVGLCCSSASINT